MTRTITCAVLALVCLSSTAGWCGDRTQESTTTVGAGVKYFQSITGVSHPFRLYRELPREEALRSGKYFRGTFAGDRLSRIERYIDHKLIFIYEYAYHASGSIARATLYDGEEKYRVLVYDEHERLIEDNRADPPRE